MYCRNCGNKMAEGDKFCSSCGAKAVADDSILDTSSVSVANISPEPATSVDVSEAKLEPISDDTPLFEPFDFKAFGFDFSELGLGTGVKTEETEPKPTPSTEEFDWNTGEFPDRNTATKTEDINFNWSLTPDEVEATEKHVETVIPEMTVTPAEPEKEVPKVEPKKEEKESGIFESLGNKADETRKQSEEIDKFFTFHQKNEEFQKILDREYEKVKSGNIIAEEISAAEAGAEEKFTSRQPEDPMEELFAAEGIIKGYEPKPIETDVLERIEAAEEEKRVREEAARLIEQEKARLAAEAEAARKAKEVAADVEEIIKPAEEITETVEGVIKPAEEITEAVEGVIEPAEEITEAVEGVIEPAEEITETVEGVIEPAEEITETVEEITEPAEEIKETVAETPEMEEASAEVNLFDIFEQLESMDDGSKDVEPEEVSEESSDESSPETVEIEKASVEDSVEPDTLKEKAVAAETEELTVDGEEVPEKTKTVDKAAILAGMAIANEMVERDRSIAAEQAVTAAAEAAEAAARNTHIEATNVELPDFLGHEDVVESATNVEENMPTVEDIVEEPVEDHTPEEDVEFDIFEQLENAEAESPAEEIVLTDSQTLVDLFADAETVENHEKGFTEHTLILSEESVADILNATGDEAVTDDTTLFSAETLGAILAEAEQENPNASEVVVSVESLADVPVAEGNHENAESEEEEEEEGSGKGRVVLKILLVILIIMLALEVTGVVIKIAAPTSGAANFIDDQLNKVFQLISGEDDKELSVFAEAEEIRTEPLKDKTELIEAEKGKNKNGNIGSIVYSEDLAFDSEKKYENTDLNLTQDLTDVAWYRDANNKQVYYDQAIVGAIIAYDSQRVNLVNNNDTSVLNMMVEGTDLYSEVQGSAKGTPITFETLTIGEIRQSGSSYFIWVAESIDGKTVEYIYEMQPEGETMKIKARYEA